MLGNTQQSADAAANEGASQPRTVAPTSLAHGILDSEVPAQLLITQPLALLLTPWFGKLCVFWCFFDTLLSIRGKALLSFKIFTVLAMESGDVTPKSATRTRMLPSQLMI